MFSAWAFFMSHLSEMFLDVEKIILLKRAVNNKGVNGFCGIFIGHFRLKYFYISDCGCCYCYSFIIIALDL